MRTRRDPQPPLPATPVEAAALAAESIRILDHLTAHTTSYRWPSDVDATLAELQALAERLPQALRQANRWLTTEHDADRIGHDRTPDPAAIRNHLHQLGADLERAANAADALTHALATARRTSSHLTGTRGGSR